jgi:predicted transcriptional regulator
MSFIDLSKSKSLTAIISTIINDMAGLNSIDSSIKKIIDQLKQYLQNPAEVEGEQLKATLKSALDISTSYDDMKLAHLLTQAIEETDFLTLSQRLTHSDKLASLSYQIDYFYKLAHRV